MKGRIATSKELEMHLLLFIYNVDNCKKKIVTNGFILTAQATVGLLANCSSVYKGYWHAIYGCTPYGKWLHLVQM